jgi:hypothetical protein
MAYSKELFNVSYHYDDDSWMYNVWELDTWLRLDEIKKYIEKFWREWLIKYIEWLSEYIDRISKIK